MSSVNHHLREIGFKIVYYGAGLCGKTTSLQAIHGLFDPQTRGQLLSLSTGDDRTLYFDFLPLKLPKVRGYDTRVHLYTVPGQVHYNATRKLVLSGVDGIVFVVDSQPGRMEANVESLHNLIENLRDQGDSLDRLPWIIQYNKRDVVDVVAIEELEENLNPGKVQTFETVATEGRGVLAALKTIVRLVLDHFRQRESGKGREPGRFKEPEQDDKTTLPRIGSASVSGQLTVPASGEPSSERGASPSKTGGSSLLSSTATETINEAIEGALASPSPAEADHPSEITRPDSLSTLVRLPDVAHAIASVENDIRRGDWLGAAKRASQTCQDLAARLAGASRTIGDSGPLMSAAFFFGVPPTRFVQFREVDRRARANGVVASVDAVFALFFLTDFALLVESRL